MKPWQEAKRWQMKNSETSFEVVLADYMNNGYVVNGPDAFIMGKPVLWSEGSMYGGDVEPNCWLVQLAAGKGALKRFLEVAPFKLEYVAWHRHGGERYRIYKWEKYEHKVKRYGQHKDSSTTSTRLEAGDDRVS